MKAFKGFKKTPNGKLGCNGFIYEEGKTYTMSENEIQLCKNGFHACEDLYDCLNYYPWHSDGSTEFHEVECSGKIIKNENVGSKFVCSEITIGKKVELPFIENVDIDECDSFNEGYATIRKDDKWNYIGTNGKLLSSEWFDICAIFNKGKGIVKKGNKYNYIKKDGTLSSEEWFDYCDCLFEECSIVEKDGIIYKINKNGFLL